MSVLKEIVRKLGQDIPNTELSTWTNEQVSFMTKYIGKDGVSDRQNEVFGTFLARIQPYLPLTISSRNAIRVMHTARRTGKVVELGNPEGAIWRTGGVVMTTPKEVLLVTGAGAITEIPLTVLPTVNRTERKYIDTMTVLLCAFTKVKYGGVECPFQPETFSKVWAMDSVGFDPDSSELVASAFLTVLRNSPECKHMLDLTYSKSGDVALREIRQALCNMSEELYNLLHTQIVFDFLRPYEKRNKPDKHGVKYSVRQRMRGSEVAVRPESYEIRRDESLFSKDSLKALRKMGYPYFAYFKGHILPTVEIPANTGIGSALNAKAKATELRGSDRSPISFISGQTHFSGLATPLVRRLMTAVSMAGGVLQKGLSVDILLETAGHAEIIFTSLETWFPRDEGHKWYLILDRRSAREAKSSVAKAVRIAKTSDHVVVYTPQGMTTQKGMKHNTSDEEVQRILRCYQKKSNEWVPEGYDEYTILTTLYGYYPWQKPDAENKKGVSSAEDSEEELESPLSNSRSFIPRRSPVNEHYVYAWGNVDQFVGIVSTIPSYALFGMEVSVSLQVGPKKREFKELETEVKMVPLQLVETEKEWYSKVIEANVRRMVYWCIARPRYSPVSNVLRVPSTGLSIIKERLSDVETVTDIDLYQVSQMSTGYQDDDDEYDFGDDAQYEEEEQDGRGEDEDERELSSDSPESESDPEEEVVLTKVLKPKGVVAVSNKKKKNAVFSFDEGEQMVQEEEEERPKARINWGKKTSSSKTEEKVEEEKEKKKMFTDLED